MLRRARAALSPLLDAIGPDRFVRSIHDIDPEALQARGFRGVLFDIDDTLGTWGFPTFDAPVLEHLRTFPSAGLKTAFVSNHEGDGREALARSLDGAPVLWASGKPKRRGFDNALAAIDCRPTEVAMVGDRLFIDVWGARRLGIYAILVEPVVGPDIDESISLRLTRKLERGLVEAQSWARPRRP